MSQVLEARAGNLAPCVPEFRVPYPASAAPDRHSASCSSGVSSYGRRHRCVSHSAGACLPTNTPARALTCLRKPCAPDPVEKGGAGCSTGACELLSQFFNLFSFSPFVFNLNFFLFFSFFFQFFSFFTRNGTQACLR